MGWQGWSTAILQLVTALLEAVRRSRSRSVRRRAADDGAGVLLGQLNPGSPDAADAAGADKPATSGTGRSSGGVDEQR